MTSMDWLNFRTQRTPGTQVVVTSIRTSGRFLSGFLASQPTSSAPLLQSGARPGYTQFPIVLARFVPATIH